MPGEARLSGPGLTVSRRIDFDVREHPPVCRRMVPRDERQVVAAIAADDTHFIATTFRHDTRSLLSNPSRSSYRGSIRMRCNNRFQGAK